MNKEKLLKEALERLGIHTQKELKEAIAKIAVNISIMAAVAEDGQAERLVG